MKAFLRLGIFPSTPGRDDSKYTVLKLWHIPSKVDCKAMERIAHGAVKLFHWGEEGLAETRKAFYHLFANLGGFKVRLHVLQDQDMNKEGGRKRTGEVDQPLLTFCWISQLVPWTSLSQAR